MHKQELRISTDDYSVALEFERPDEISIMDMCEAKVKQMKSNYNLDTIELSIDEYADIKRRVHELEVRNNLLQQQVMLLKSEAFKRYGTLTKYIEEQRNEEVKKVMSKSNPEGSKEGASSPT